MNDKEFALECMKVQNLDFVDKVITVDHEPYIYIELSPSLTAVLPPTLSIMQFFRSDFTVKQVIIRFQVQVVERLTSAAELALDQLRSAKAQAWTL